MASHSELYRVYLGIEPHACLTGAVSLLVPAVLIWVGWAPVNSSTPWAYVRRTPQPWKASTGPAQRFPAIGPGRDRPNP